MNRPSHSAAPAGGVTFPGLLTLLFIALKLLGVISWSWLWVLSPMWISLCLIILVVAVITLAPLGRK